MRQGSVSKWFCEKVSISGNHTNSWWIYSFIKQEIFFQWNFSHSLVYSEYVVVGKISTSFNFYIVLLMDIIEKVCACMCVRILSKSSSLRVLAAAATAEVKTVTMRRTSWWWRQLYKREAKGARWTNTIDNIICHLSPRIFFFLPLFVLPKKKSWMLKKKSRENLRKDGDENKLFWEHKYLKEKKR